jgi:hypothetical protein
VEFSQITEVLLSELSAVPVVTGALSG